MTLKGKIQNAAFYTMVSSLTATILFGICYSALPFIVALHVTGIAFLVWFFVGTHRS